MTRKCTTDLHSTAAQPAWSRVALEQTGIGFRLTLPALGIGRHLKGMPWQPAQSLFWVGVIFCLLLALLTLFFLALPHLAAYNTVGGKPVTYSPNDLVVPWPVWAGLAGFWAIGLASILGSANLCRREGIFELTEDTLRCEQTSLFGRRCLESPREQIVAVQTGPTGLTIGAGTSSTTVNMPTGVRVAELHVYLKDGKRVGLFAGRSEAELDWIAAELRKALQVGRVKYEG